MLFASEAEAQAAAERERLRVLEEAGHVHRFSGLLSVGDRERLRKIVRAEHLRHYPGDLLTNYECDKFIDSFSEGYVAEQLKRGDVYG